MYTLIHQDPRFYLVDKHPGASFHREGDAPGLMDALRAGLDDEALWPVHRLDRITSGLILVARSAGAARALGDALAGREVEKYYLALSDRKPLKKQGRVAGDMAKGRGGAWRLTAGRENPAVTQFFSYALAPGLRLFLLRPRTGKTHQLRVAMKSQGAPILGDALYGGSEADRGYLHAYALRFELDGERFAFVCPPSAGERFIGEACRDRLAELGEPWAQPWPGA
ncbi:TIGR01621 family pseudouridine synthase [Chromobacterium violaceum]|uniref:TIGR01621 family pseudouridine synthase n=1 Tax=Chromobacterium violaceum TaxID=536 RepID=UPI0009D9E8B2|nr:TIGR01621 family pseudouridine synthase [Chromobacterium violaceum]MBX9268708.1 TIGR01621 family pseudouridine synthase [Chromobacterium violaceum]OQS48282.1 RNA pseudouridine synthase [Chromobacterium violaceum]OQS49802.1 RNA pseudouridine synthase [Chromobacterium violaceum]QRO35101.1 TIGR01621 family pseudouridine synthase [Chromobacterium violaceum]QRQ15094.1 TIGR01621 family pseudouridine synthase [Chromobacterium violaceum]